MMYGFAEFTPRDHEAAEAMISLLYGGATDAGAGGALAPLEEKPEVPDKPKKGAKRVKVVANVKVFSGAGSSQVLARRTRRRRVPKKRFESSSESSSEEAVEEKKKEVEEEEEETGDVPIGTGQTIIPKEKYARIRWRDYRFATRSFLDALFPRSVLATHSVTGKPSPAFAHKPAKKQLNPVIVNDIVKEVSETYQMPPSVIRSIITTKCADESKIAQNKKKQKELGIPTQKRGRRPKKSGKPSNCVVTEM